MITPQRPRKLSRGDRVALLSPSFAAPAIFPAVHERGVETLLRELQLEPVEFPTTRQLNASPRSRAEDLNAAFADSSIRAIMATIGGDDQLTVLPYLEAELVAHDPPAFFGYSDNTNLLLWLWHHGVGAYHGGSTLVHLARPGSAHEVHLTSLRRALFEAGRFELEPVKRFTDLEPDWGDLSTLEFELPSEEDPPWQWRGDGVVSGVTWGGNLEILHWNLAANRWVGANEDFKGAVLLLETSEEMPGPDEVFRMLRNLGERGLLEQFSAIVMAKAKAWSRQTPLDAKARRAFRQRQSEVLFQASAAYAPNALVVYGPDFGHTDPQIVVPYGAVMTVDATAQRIWAQY